MAPIYSTQVVNAAYGAPHSGVVYTVPAPATLILTDVETLLHPSASGQTSYLQIGAFLLMYFLSTGTAFVPQQWTGKQVLTGGQQISWTMPGSGSYLAITGYLLN